MDVEYFTRRPPCSRAPALLRLCKSLFAKVLHGEDLAHAANTAITVARQRGNCLLRLRGTSSPDFLPWSRASLGMSFAVSTQFRRAKTKESRVWHRRRECILGRHTRPEYLQCPNHTRMRYNNWDGALVLDDGENILEESRYAALHFSEGLSAGCALGDIIGHPACNIGSA